MAVASLTWLLILLLHTLFVFSAAQPKFLHQYCGSNANYTANSTYQNNLNTLLSTFPANIDPNSLFYGASLGEAPDRVNAMAICRGDYPLENCRRCVLNCTRKITQICPYQKEAIGVYDREFQDVYDHCALRYSYTSIFEVPARKPAFHLKNWDNVSEITYQFNQELKKLLDDLRGQAMFGGSIPRLFAVGNRSIPNSATLFGLVQCTKDLSPKNCGDCLIGATGEISRFIGYSKGGRVDWPSCSLWYELYSIYNESALRFTRPSSPPTQPPQLQPPASPPPGLIAAGGKNGTTQTVIIIVVPIVVAMVLLLTVCMVLLFSRRRMRKPIDQQFDGIKDISVVESLQCDFSTIRAATNDFSDDNKLGQGGFGAVYKGKLPNEQAVAVKRLSSGSRQGELEFKTEVLLVAKLQHRNLVRLLGFCLEGAERLLVYEYLPNASLDKFIFDQAKRADLDWDIRYKIIEGIARGLVYLHEDSRFRVIHRDLKASNVLLDEEMNPKIADFGMARLFPLDDSRGNTRRIAGTHGYMAPEYAIRGQFSVKSDVFSFGTIVLEIISGQRSLCFQNGESIQDLLSYAWKSWRDGSTSNVIDPTLRAHSGSIQEITRCIHIGLLCVQENAIDRPTMASVLVMLSSVSLTLAVPLEPAFLMHSWTDPETPLLAEQNSRTTSSNQSTKTDTINEASITELYPR